MNELFTNPEPTRRDTFLGTGKLAAVSALAGVAVPYVHAGEKNTIQVALIGCGGRGTSAAGNALQTKQGPVKLVAMADVFKDRLDSSFKNLNKSFAKQMEVTDDRKFVSFDGYKAAMDLLNPGDVVILATPPAFRWVHFSYAIKKGLNVFMEKPVTVDGPTSRRMFELGEESEKKGLKVGVGLMCRHCDARKALFERIKDGAIGDIILARAYRQAGPTASAFSGPKPADMSELMYQVRRFHSFLWLSGGAFSDFLIHNIDEACWMKDTWPVKAQASGGRHYREKNIDQNFDTYSVEYTFADGTKFFMEGRVMSGCHQEFATYVHGTKGSAIVSSSGHMPAVPRIFNGHNMSDKSAVVWNFPGEEPSPYQLEWENLMKAIRADKPFNEVKRGVEASLATAMGRFAAHTGRVVTREQMLKNDHEFAPNVDSLVIDGPAPLQADKDGKYPIPEPGRKTKREY